MSSEMSLNLVKRNFKGPSQANQRKPDKCKAALCILGVLILLGAGVYYSLHCIRVHGKRKYVIVISGSKDRIHLCFRRSFQNLQCCDSKILVFLILDNEKVLA